MIEKKFDIPFIAQLALREKQIQQNYRPVIAVHKWFARRPGTLFRGLILSEFTQDPLKEAFYKSHNLKGLCLADPFMGGGTPILEANRLGCDVMGYDINPMAYWIVKQEIEHLNLDLYAKEAQNLRAYLENEIGPLYRTQCLTCGSHDAHVKYFLWVKTIPCKSCGEEIRLFPGYLLSSDARHPRNVFVCPQCGGLTETKEKKNPGNCIHCSEKLHLQGPAARGHCACPACSSVNTFPNPSDGPPGHRLFALEYHCPTCKPQHMGRFFKEPDTSDLHKIHATEQRWASLIPAHVPEDEIPKGDETNRLHRWGYRKYHEMFNIRQLLGLELSARFIASLKEERTRNALATNLSDLLRYQNMLCRYDTTALKSLDIFSVHGFPVGLIQCESNLIGIMETGRQTCIGSGGWANIIEKYKKAKTYCTAPFEILHNGSQKKIIPIKDEWIGDTPPENTSRIPRKVVLSVQDAATGELEEASLDAVFTDPPYFGNVQYAELMDFCYVWLRRLLVSTCPVFQPTSTRTPGELTGNAEMGRGLDHFTEGLSAVFRHMAKALKPGAPLAFTYHHNSLDAYYPLAVAILDAGLTCSASLPCPAEMGASIHINGTGSSIIDTVFVSRSKGITLRRWIGHTPEALADMVKRDVSLLQEGKVTPSAGDIRCIGYGHLIRLAIWFLRENWNPQSPTSSRIEKVAQWIQTFGGRDKIESLLSRPEKGTMEIPLPAVHENPSPYGEDNAEISF